MAIPIPLLQQGSPNLVTNQEWQQFHNDMDAWENQVTLDIHLLNPAAQIEQAPLYGPPISHRPLDDLDVPPFSSPGSTGYNKWRQTSYTSKT